MGIGPLRHVFSPFFFHLISFFRYRLLSKDRGGRTVDLPTRTVQPAFPLERNCLCCEGSTEAASSCLRLPLRLFFLIDIVTFPFLTFHSSIPYHSSQLTIQS